MEDFIEIIFYVVILVLSGIGSLIKNSKKNKPNQPTTVLSQPQEVVVEEQPVEEEENELIKMLREAAAAAEAQQREKEILEQQEVLRVEEIRQKEEAERARKAQLLQAQIAAENAKKQQKLAKPESDKVNDEQSVIFGLNMSDVDEVKRAFIASEIFNKKYC